MSRYVQEDNPSVEDDETLVVVPRPGRVDELEVSLRGGSTSYCTSTHCEVRYTKESCDWSNFKKLEESGRSHLRLYTHMN